MSGGTVFTAQTSTTGLVNTSDQSSGWDDLRSLPVDPSGVTTDLVPVSQSGVSTGPSGRVVYITFLVGTLTGHL